jgi:hypothetical protein
MPNIRYFNTTAREAALDWLYEDGGFNPDNIKKCSVLAVTNVDVDAWNTMIQQRNTTQPEPTLLRSHDKLADVDDDKNYLQQCLPTYVLNDFTNPSKAPPHELHLKVTKHTTIIDSFQSNSFVLISAHFATD